MRSSNTRRQSLPIVRFTTPQSSSMRVVAARPAMRRVDPSERRIERPHSARIIEALVVAEAACSADVPSSLLRPVVSHSFPPQRGMRLPVQSSSVEGNEDEEEDVEETAHFLIELGGRRYHCILQFFLEEEDPEGDEEEEQVDDEDDK